MIREIRDYFDKQIKEIDPDLEEYDRDLFGNNDLNKRQAEKNYNLVIGTTTNTRQVDSYIDEIPITLSIWTSSNRCVSESFDSLYDKALQIRNNCVCPRIVKEAGFTNKTLLDVIPLTVIPNEEETKDQTLRFDATFLLKVGFKFQ